MIIGIDLGTTNSVAAYLNDEHEAEILENDDGNEKTPSVVLLEEDDGETRPVVGETAERRRLLAPDRVLHRTKQDMDKDELPSYEIEGKDRDPDPVEAAAMILRHMKNEATATLAPGADGDGNGDGDGDARGGIEGAVITVPYDFTYKGRERTKQAGAAAGIDVKEVINEPTAACLSYIHQNDISGTLLVYDLGGGTFDATLVDASSVVIDVISTEGDGELGGEDFDDALYELAREKIREAGGTDPEDVDRSSRTDLRTDLKELKHRLSDSTEERYVYSGGDDVVEISIAREEFEDAIREDVERTFDKMEELFEKEPTKEAGIDRETVDHVLLVGGSTRIPLVRERVTEFFGQEPLRNVNQDTVVASGAAIQAADYRDDIETPVDITIRNVLSHNVGVELNTGEFDRILDEDVTVPTQETSTGYTNPRANLSAIEIPVWEKGEDGAQISDTDGAENLGTLTIGDLPAGTEANELDIEVTFTANHDGTLEVEAYEKVTDQRVRTEIDAGLDRRSMEEIGAAVGKVDSSAVSRADDD